jgi:glycosyltransferase involved in cell wall biosynthesis
MRKKCGLDQVVRFLGFRSDIEKILACLDLFVLPSTTEGFSIATIEAMASGLPVVVTNSGGPREIVTHLKDGLLVEPNCPEGLAEGITRCLTDHELRRSMGAKARNTVEEEFSMKRMLEKYEDLYARTIGGGQN